MRDQRFGLTNLHIVGSCFRRIGMHENISGPTQGQFFHDRKSSGCKALCLMSGYFWGGDLTLHKDESITDQIKSVPIYRMRFDNLVVQLILRRGGYSTAAPKSWPAK